MHDLQSAALREFDFLHNEDREVTRSGPLILGSLPSSVPTTPISVQDCIVPPSPQPLVEFPDDEVKALALFLLIGRTVNNPYFYFSFFSFQFNVLNCTYLFFIRFFPLLFVISRKSAHAPWYDQICFILIDSYAEW